MIVTSRPYSSIERQFRNLPTIRLRVEDETEALSADIKIVVNGSIDRLGVLWDLPDEVRDRLKDKLVKNADRTFLWVSLILDLLLNTPKPSESEYDGILRDLPRDLDATFEKILRQIPNPDDARRVLHVVIAAPPLTLKEMNVAQAIRPRHRSMEDLQPNLMFDPQTTLKTICGLFPESHRLKDLPCSSIREGVLDKKFNHQQWRSRSLETFFVFGRIQPGSFGDLRLVPLFWSIRKPSSGSGH